MTLILSGTDGLSDIDGTAATPAIRGTDANTGIFFPAADTIAFTEGGAEAMRIDSSGNVGIGTSSPTQKLDVAGNVRVGGSTGQFLINASSTSQYPGLFFQSAGTSRSSIFIDDTGATFPTYISVNTAAPLIFRTDATERMRIDSSGNLQVNLTNIASYVGASPVGSIGNIATTAGTNSAAFLHAHASNPYGPFIYFNQSSPNNTSNYFLQCNDTTNAKAVIYSNGTFGSRTSTYGGISDIKVKQDIVDASSQWNDIKALRFRKYRFKDDPTGPLQLGLISQEAELVSPGLVFETPDTEMVEVPVLDENGEPILNEDGTPQTTTERQETGEVTKSVKYSILYMKAVKALQEAMERIEVLEAQNAAFEARLTALEAK
jgi:hypothetical protein